MNRVLVFFVLGLCSCLCSGALLPAEVDVGSSKTIYLPNHRVKLIYRGSPASEIASARWQPISGPYWVAFDSAATVNATAAFGRAGSYVLRLSINFTPSSGRLATTMDTSVLVRESTTVLNADTTAADHLRISIRPTFRDGHTLPPNSGTIQCGFNLSLELGDHWNYGFWIGILPPYCLDLNPRTNALLNAAVNSNGRYKIIASLANLLPGHGYPSDRWLTDAAAAGITIPEEVWMHDSSGSRIPTATKPEMSPFAPDSWVREKVADHGTCIRNISSFYPISAVLSGGEYGVNVGGFSSIYNDPTVLAAAGYPGQTQTYCSVTGNTCNDERYNATLTLLSRASKRHEKVIADEVTRGVSWKDNRPFYGLYTDSYGFDRARWNGWKSWMFQFEHSLELGGISTLPNPQVYWNDANSGFTGINSLFCPNDVFSKFLNEIGGGIRFGANLTYPWISNGGYPLAGNAVADRTRFMGLLKSVFTAGALGAVAGWYNYTGDVYARQYVFNGPTGPVLPDWLWLVQDIAWAQSLFSHLEPFLRDGYLLNSRRIHPYNYDPIDSPANPWYPLDVIGEPWNAEWNTGVGPRSFVVVRKLKSAPMWLISAWANVGSSRNVTFVLPGLNRNVTVFARVSGAIYIGKSVSGQFVTTLVDIDPACPSLFLFENSSLETLGLEAVMPSQITAAPPTTSNESPSMTASVPGLQNQSTSGASPTFHTNDVISTAFLVLVSLSALLL